jgi:hypothetical protein
MSNDKRHPKVKIKKTLLLIAVLLCAVLLYSALQTSIKTLSTSIQLTLFPESEKSLQSAQQSLSLNHILYTPDQLLDEWLRLENKDRNWHEALPECPKKLTLNSQPSGEALVVNPNPETWYPATLPSSLHGKGAYEIRSLPVEGSSSQCIYSQNGKLYAHEIPEAGSSDFYSINTNEYLHYIYDVEPYLLARALKRSEDYYKARPPK